MKTTNNNKKKKKGGSSSMVNLVFSSIEYIFFLCRSSDEGLL